MSTVTKSKTSARRILPPSKGTTKDLLAASKSGRFAKGVDLAMVERVVKRRRRSRDLRPVN